MRGVAGDGGDYVFMNLHKCADESRIAPAGIGFFFQQVERLVGRKCRLIRTRADECVVNIRNLQHARQQRDLFSTQAVRIAVAVPALMMMPDDGQHGSQRLHRPADFLSAGRMAAHDHPFFGAQLSGFEQD